MNRREAFEHQARHFARTSPLYERLALELRDEPLVPLDVHWRYPLQLLAGLHYLALSGRASWGDVRGALHDEAEFLRDWIATERVQTNEVQRCWWLLPGFLEVARRDGVETFDCLELGCSAGLNLLWDRYGYAYAAGSWPPDPASCSLQLAGEERGGRVPAELLGLRPVVRSRVGVDLAPPDLRTDEGVRLLKSFVWADQAERLARLDAAVAVWRDDPPEVVVGDVLDELPALLARGPSLVWSTAALSYLPSERQRAVRELVAESGVPFVEGWVPADGSHDYYGLFVDGREVAHAEFHGAWLDWRA
ncbi:MAG TPA: DUF2332 domain-containing protein [Gaiellaceae bacterium]|nr:DUF2332 domain-containing protein [Gaiellaceae bacterium]